MIAACMYVLEAIAHVLEVIMQLLKAINAGPRSEYAGPQRQCDNAEKFAAGIDVRRIGNTFKEIESKQNNNWVKIYFVKYFHF